MNKKAMFFTLIAIMLVLLFITAYCTFIVFDDNEALNDRINSLNRFVYSTEEDLSRQLYIFGSRAILILEKSISEKGEYASNIQNTFSEMFDGTYVGENSDILLGATFSDIENSIKSRADIINANATLNYNSFSITQDDPWRIKVILNASLFITDKAGLASWNKTKEYYGYINIENFEDPLYTISTHGKIIHKINSTKYYPLISGTDISNFSLHLDKNYYISSHLAPNFLQRLEGNKSSSPFGIESLVDLRELTSQGIEAQSKSCVDYIYFSNDNPLSYSITGMPTWLKIDSEHLSLYNATNLAY